MEKPEFLKNLERRLLETDELVKKHFKLTESFLTGDSDARLEPVDLQAISTLYRLMGEFLVLLRFYNDIVPNEKTIALQKESERRYNLTEEIWHSILKDMTESYNTM